MWQVFRKELTGTAGEVEGTGGARGWGDVALILAGAEVGEEGLADDGVGEALPQHPGADPQQRVRVADLRCGGGGGGEEGGEVLGQNVWPSDHVRVGGPYTLSGGDGRGI